MNGEDVSIALLAKKEKAGQPVLGAKWDTDFALVFGQCCGQLDGAGILLFEKEFLTNNGVLLSAESKEKGVVLRNDLFLVSRVSVTP